jgi:hypothetical protein
VVRLIWKIDSRRSRGSASFHSQVTLCCIGVDWLHWISEYAFSVLLISSHQWELQPEGHRGPGVVREVSPSIGSMSAVTQNLMWVVKYSVCKKLLLARSCRKAGVTGSLAWTSYTTLRKSNTTTTTTRMLRPNVVILTDAGSTWQSREMLSS